MDIKPIVTLAVIIAILALSWLTSQRRQLTPFNCNGPSECELRMKLRLLRQLEIQRQQNELELC